MNMLCDKMSWQETDAKFRLKVRAPTARLRGFATGRGDVAGTFADNGLLQRFQDPLKIDEHYWHIEHLFSNHSKTIDFKGPAWTHPWKKVADYWKLQVMRCRWQRQNFTWETHSILSCGILHGILWQGILVVPSLMFIIISPRPRPRYPCSGSSIPWTSAIWTAWMISATRRWPIFCSQMEEIGDVNLRFQKYESSSCFSLF